MPTLDKMPLKSDDLNKFGLGEREREREKIKTQPSILKKVLQQKFSKTKSAFNKFALKFL